VNFAHLSVFRQTRARCHQQWNVYALTTGDEVEGLPPSSVLDQLPGRPDPSDPTVGPWLCLGLDMPPTGPF